MRYVLFIFFVTFFIEVIGNSYTITDPVTGMVSNVILRDSDGQLFSAPTDETDDYGKKFPRQPGATCSSVHSASCGFLNGEVLVSKKSRPPLTKEWLKNVKVGQKIDALDYTNQWYTAEVKEVKDGSYKVHFDDWEEKWDEWIPWNSGRISKRLSHAQGGRLVGGTAGTKIKVYLLPETEYDAIPPSNTIPTQDDIPSNTSPKLPVGAQKQQELAQKNKKEKEKSATISDSTEKQNTGTAETSSTSGVNTPASGSSTASSSTGSTTHTEFKDKKMEEFLNSLQLWQKLDGLDGYGMWYTAKIVKIDKDRIFLSFDEWEEKWNEWIPRFSGRLAPHKTKAKGGQHSGGVRGIKIKLYKK